MQHDQHFGRGLDAPELRHVQTAKGFSGLGDIRVRTDNEVVEMFEAVIRLFCERQERIAAESAAADNSGVTGSDESAAGGAGIESAAADNSGDLAALEETDWCYTYGQRRADALAEILSIALAHAGENHAVGSDRYLVHLVADLDGLRGHPAGRAELVDGSILPAGAAARISCADGTTDLPPASRRLARRCQLPSGGERLTLQSSLTCYAEPAANIRGTSSTNSARSAPDRAS